MPELIKVERWAKVAPFNPLSPPQVKAYIKSKGYPMPKHRTDRDEFGERKDTTNDESLSELLREGKPGEGDEVLEGILKVRHISKGASYLAGTYVRPDGRLHPIYTMRPKQRLSSTSPNVMVLPKGKKGIVLKRASREVLASVVADPGFTLFSCDWNSLHPALIAYFAGDPQYARVARLGDHANVLSHYLGRPVDLNRSDEEVKAELDALKESHPAEYKTCKIGNLAYKYLQGPMNMAKSLGLSLERTLAIRAAIDQAAPKVAAWKWKVLEQAHFKGRLVSPFGLPLSFFDVFRTENGKVLMDRDGKPKLGLEAPEACSFFPLSTESGMLREVLVDLGSQEECWSTFKLSIPEHDKVIGQIRDGEVDRILDSLVIPSMNRAWPELGGLRVGVDVEVGKTMQEMRARG